MRQVLTWLPEMLVQLELGATAELDGQGSEDDELDEDFVNMARPWLHTNEYHSVGGTADFAEQVWKLVAKADYLRPTGKGGAMLLLLPDGLPYSLMQTVTNTLKETVHAHVNAEASVTSCHPDATAASARSPTPLIQVFKDSPDLLVDGGSMSDAAGFL